MKTFSYPDYIVYYWKLQYRLLWFYYINIIHRKKSVNSRGKCITFRILQWSYL